MIDIISSDYELKFLKTMGIELRNGKLIKVSTNEEYTHVHPEKIEEDGDYIFKCGKSLVIFNTLSDKTPNKVSLIENGIEISTYEIDHEGKHPETELERELEIRKYGTQIVAEIKTECKYADYFLETTIKFEHNLDYFNILQIACNFENLCVSSSIYPNRTYDISEDNIKIILKDCSEKIISDAEIYSAYKKCLPFLCGGYDRLLEFPAHRPDRFEEAFNKEEGEMCRLIMCDMVDRKRGRDTTMNSIITKPYDKGVIDHIAENSSFSTYMSNKIDKYIERKAEIDEKRKKYRNYVISLEDKKPQLKRIRCDYYYPHR